MSSPAKTPAPLASDSFDDAFEEEESGVHARAARAARAARDAETSPGPAPSGRGSSPGFATVTERTHRIESKMAIAESLISRLSPLDSRGRLLASAMLRRDEVLLDAVLSQMGEEFLAVAKHPSRLPR